MAQLVAARGNPTDSSAVAAPAPDLHDRIMEAYYGKMGEGFARSTRERIHWICAHVEGTRVLDVGCSQGVAAILLGREGKKVVGIDAARRSIDEARDYLTQESPRVQEHVAFIHGDFLAHKFGPDSFDTVILAEVLEHLIHPERFIAAAAERVAQNGRLIVTVPFGVNDWPDHKQTFYLLEPWRLISSYFAVEDVKLFGKWIGFVARRTDQAKTNATTPRPDILIAAEAAFQKIERELIDRVKVLSQQAADLRIANEHNAALHKSATEKCSEKEREAFRLAAELAASLHMVEYLQRGAETYAQNFDAEQAARVESERDNGSPSVARKKRPAWGM